MRNRLALIIAIAILNCNTNVVADMPIQNKDISTDQSIDSHDAEESTIITIEELIEDSNIETQNLSDDETEEFEESLSQLVVEDDIGIDLTEISREINDKSTINLSDENIETELTELEKVPAEELSDITAALQSEIETEIMEEKEVISSEIETGTINEIEQDMENGYVYHVSFPTSTVAFLDPGNLSGKGQIFSEQYIVENYGNIDITIKIGNINICYDSEKEQYEFTKDEITENYTAEKKMNVNMVWRNEVENTEKILNVMEGTPNECVLTLKAAEYDENNKFVRLNSGSTGLFYFTGTLNNNTNIIWNDSDLLVSFDYEIVYAHEEQDIIENMEETEEERSSDVMEESLTEDFMTDIVEDDAIKTETIDEIEKEEQKSFIEIERDTTE